MSEKDNGGPAFPRAAGDYHGTKNGNGAQSGMTLRDYFAAKAMQALVSCDDYDNTCPGYAKMAYDMADAMLKARGN